MEKIIWGIDPGSSICGVSKLSGGLIGDCFECEPKLVYRRIMSLCGADKVTVVIEDIFPYSLKLTPAVIDTCKLIGELTYRFKKCRQVSSIELVARNSVKKWVFDTVPEVCLPRIAKKIDAKHTKNLSKGLKGLTKLDGEMRKPSFNWVDDRIVKEAMKIIHDIPEPLPGKSNIYGIKKDSHVWSALAVATYLFRTATISGENR
jgi:hypothetical protein